MTIQDRQFGSFEYDSSLQKWRRHVKDQGSYDLLQQILDGPLNFTEVDNSESVFLFSEINAIPQNTRTSIISYTVPIGKKFRLKQITCGGDNIAIYEVEVDSILKSRKRSYFGSSFDIEFKFGDDNGIEFSENTLINIFVEHSRPSSSDFDSTIIGSLTNV